MTSHSLAAKYALPPPDAPAAAGVRLEAYARAVRAAVSDPAAPTAPLMALDAEALAALFAPRPLARLVAQLGRRLPTCAEPG